MTVQGRQIYTLIAFALGVIVCMMAAVSISITASNRAIQESERRQCESVQADVTAYREVPPTTPGGKNQLRSKEVLLRVWNCPTSQPK